MNLKKIFLIVLQEFKIKEPQHKEEQLWTSVLLEGEGSQKEREGVEVGREREGRSEETKLPLLISVPTHPH